MADVVDRIPDLLDRGRVLGAQGEYIGQIGQIFRDDRTGRPTWVSVDAPNGQAQALVPLVGEVVDGDDVHVGYDAATVTAAPRTAVGAPLTLEDERGLRAYYGISDEKGGSPASVVRSEERLHLSTRRIPVRRARLEKFQVTEMRTITVPVIRDDVRVVYDVIENGSSDQIPSEPRAEFRPWVLMEERIVITKEMVPVETVRLSVETVTEQREITEDVRKEQITLHTSAAGSPQAPSVAYDGRQDLA